MVRQWGWDLFQSFRPAFTSGTDNLESSAAGWDGNQPREPIVLPNQLLPPTLPLAQYFPFRVMYPAQNVCFRSRVVTG